MPRYSANISILFTERPFIARFAAAREAGFEAVECWFPYDHGTAELKAILDGEGLTLVGINTAPGDVAKANGASPPCPAAKPNSTGRSRRRWSMRRRSARAASMSWLRCAAGWTWRLALRLTRPTLKRR